MEEMLEEVRTRKTISPANRYPYQRWTEEIKVKARELWVQKGCPQGKDLNNWLEAEKIIRTNH